MTETLQCKAGHEWTRNRVRGPKPIYCPDHAPRPEKEEVDEQTRAQRVAERLAKARQTRAENAVKRAEEERERERERNRDILVRAKSSLSKCNEEYSSLLKEVAQRERYDPQSWHKLEVLQDRVLRTLSTIRKLENA